MDIKHMQHHREQSGFVAILTVIFFSLLMSVISIGFLRLMIQEQQQALQDDLSKSAYQSAQAGVEDAKRALLYCAGLPVGTDKDACENQLYFKDCPGFNAAPVAGLENYFFTKLGIPTAVSGSEGTGVGSAAARQGYSCVIVTRDTTSLSGKLTPNTTSDATFVELRTRTTTPYTSIRIKWHTTAQSGDGTPYIPLAGTFTHPTQGGNPRFFNWPTETAEVAPALLRAKLITLPATGNFTLSQAKMNDFFLYPSRVGTDAAVANMPNALPGSRIETKCTASPSGATADYGNYACTMDIKFVDAVGSPTLVSQSGRRYLMLQTMYRATHYEITASNELTGQQVFFDGIQPTIDATGYTSGVYRRIKVGVRLGSESLATNAALDTGLGICKDFRVGGSTTVFDNDDCN